MKQFFFISLFFLSFFKAQNLKIEYDRINKNATFNISSAELKDFKGKVEEESKKPQKFFLYFLDGDTFFKNLPKPEITYTGDSKKVDDNTTITHVGSYKAPQIKMYHKKGDKGFYQYLNFDDDQFYHYSIPQIDKIEYKGDTELIENYKCKLAEIVITGSLYKVWYTEDIPVSAGPYTFNNLPGLVMKIDAANYVIYATKISNEGKKSDFEIINPKFKVLNDDEYSKKMSEVREDAKKVKETRNEVHL